MSQHVFLSFIILFWMEFASTSRPLSAADDKETYVVSRETRGYTLPDDEVVYCIAFSPDGRRVLAGTASGRVWIWDTNRSEPAKQVNVASGDLLKGGVISMAFSQDGKRVLLGCGDSTVRLWDITTFKEIHNLKGHGGPVWSVIVSKDGKRAFSGSTSDFTIREWDLEKGRQIRCFTGKDRPDSLSLSRDERWLVTTEFRNVRLWDLKSGKAGASFEGHSFRVAAAFFTPDGKQIVSASLGEVRVWDVRTKKAVITFGDGDLLVNSVALSPHGTRVLLGGTKNMQLWDVKTGKQLKRMQKLSGTVKVAYSPNGSYAAIY